MISVHALMQHPTVSVNLKDSGEFVSSVFDNITVESQSGR